ncbi:hypothetical protein ABF81_07055 [Enterobacter hormaechei subsp. steigerwaltii]|nr:hypothetical protein ABF81_07055 [Enterobacter hormaechei subsp. steigerwaltii]KZQ42639.1 hypothetical protein A3N44_21450 [Enterobacter hormaechei subsp. steigerwaltii]
MEYPRPRQTIGDINTHRHTPLLRPPELRYAIDAELKGVGLVRYGTEFMPEGRVLIRHLKQQQYLDARAAI